MHSIRQVKINQSMMSMECLRFKLIADLSLQESQSLTLQREMQLRKMIVVQRPLMGLGQMQLAPFIMKTLRSLASGLKLLVALL